MSAKSVVWVHPFGPAVASYRYRAQIPCEQVGKINGYTTAINDGEADIVVFSKPTVEQMELLKKVKDEGATIVVDFSDDHFNHSRAGPVYRDFVAAADHIVTGSDVMRGRIYDYVKRDSTVLPDPYEQDEIAPHADGEELLWFGHSLNLPEIMQMSDTLQGRKVKIASGPISPNGGPVIWGPEALGKALAEANVVLLPTIPGASYKTPNRLMNAIRSGCFAVCMPHPAYTEFQDYVWVGDFLTGLRWIDVFHMDLNDCVLSAQDYIRDRYSPEAIGRKWASYFDSL